MNLWHIGSECHNLNCLNCKKVVTSTIWNRSVSHITQLVHEMADFASQPKNLTQITENNWKWNLKSYLRKFEIWTLIYLYKKSYLTVAALTVVFVPIPPHFSFSNKIFCHMPGDLDGRTNWYYFNKEIWKITQEFCWKPNQNVVVENHFISQK